MGPVLPTSVVVAYDQYVTPVVDPLYDAYLGRFVSPIVSLIQTGRMVYRRKMKEPDGSLYEGKRPCHRLL